MSYYTKPVYDSEEEYCTCECGGRANKRCKQRLCRKCCHATNVECLVTAHSNDSMKQAVVKQQTSKLAFGSHDKSRMHKTQYTIQIKCLNGQNANLAQAAWFKKKAKRCDWQDKWQIYCEKNLPKNPTEARKINAEFQTGKYEDIAEAVLALGLMLLPIPTDFVVSVIRGC